MQHNRLFGFFFGHLITVPEIQLLYYDYYTLKEGVMSIIFRNFSTSVNVLK